MALRGTLTHRKTRRLAKLLGISPVFALGILEALWHVTAEQCPNGAIGVMSNLDIAEEMFYEGDADKLINALVESGWLDIHAQHRLLVHDWQDHADQSVKRKVARHGNGFADIDESRLVMASSPEPESRARVQSQSPVPVPEPEGKGESRSKGTAFKKPEPSEISEYMASRGWPDPQGNSERFWSYYQSNGWKVGRSAMRDWKACVHTWEGRMKQDGKWPKPDPSKIVDEDNRDPIEGIDFRFINGQRLNLKNREPFDEKRWREDRRGAA